MNSTLRNILAVFAGLIIGGIVNYSIIVFGSTVIAPPPGVDPEDIESIKAGAHLYTYKHFLVPFLAHGLGTLIGAYVVSKLAISRFKVLSLVIGAIFFMAGLSMAILLPEFLKYSIVDLLLAYFPMAFLGWKLAGEPK
ncbi:MAG: hypothetical protein P1U56_17835 [Saprospiraceae bacterium]|nr:hypothetical protein [Saprospiraceae bacterium]